MNLDNNGFFDQVYPKKTGVDLANYTSITAEQYAYENDVSLERALFELFSSPLGFTHVQHDGDNWFIRGKCYDLYLTDNFKFAQHWDRPKMTMVDESPNINYTVDRGRTWEDYCLEHDIQREYN
ncbi:hypothetical protein AHIS2_p023 [Acaryochloris phage A-HIS2]|nr:hypothetical protein AHIS2_p023 [Acaryochloris phage A-HIS2]